MRPHKGREKSSRQMCTQRSLRGIMRAAREGREKQKCQNEQGAEETCKAKETNRACR